MADDEDGIRCVGVDGTYSFQLTKGASVRDLAAQLAAETGQAGSLNIRIFLCGRELRHHELAASIGTGPVHFVLCPDGPLSRGSSVEFGPGGVLAYYGLPAEHAEDQDAWIDALDPCALLMVIFAAVLGGFWLTFLVYPAMFDGASIAMLVTMTIAYVLPAIYQRVPIVGPVITAPDHCYQDHTPQGVDNQEQQHNYDRVSAISPTVKERVPPRPVPRVMRKANQGKPGGKLSPLPAVSTITPDSLTRSSRQ